jgi:hypothetical protein
LAATRLARDITVNTLETRLEIKNGLGDLSLFCDCANPG